MLRQAEPRRNLPGPLVRQPLPSANTAQDLLAAATRGAAFSRAAKWFFIGAAAGAVAAKAAH